MNHIQAWCKFIETYPFRNGKRIRLEEARIKLFKLKVKDLPLIIKATVNYTQDKDVKANIGIRDAHRYIKDGKGIEIWRDYIKVKPTNKAHYSTPEDRKRDADNLRTGKTLSFQEVGRRLIAELKKKRKK